MVLLRLRDEEGATGLGEAVPLSLRGGASLERVVAELEGLAEGSWAPVGPLGAAEGLSPPARCAVETALMDLRGRRDVAQRDPTPVPTSPVLGPAVAHASLPRPVDAR